VRGLDPEVAAGLEDAAAAFAELGAVVEPADPGFEDPAAAFRVLWYAGASQNLRRMTPAQRALVDPGLQEVAAEAEGFTASDLIEAQAVRARMGMAMAALHRRYDLLLTPTLPITAFEKGMDAPKGWHCEDWTSWTPYTYPFNMTQQPAASVPCGFTSAGLPVGLQIVGPRYGDATVLRAMHAYASAYPEATIAPAFS
jgi:aspartyl-tRNA(Asn)/glutamyl-tRNA(Gln) amidotransferase subunit A